MPTEPPEQPPSLRREAVPRPGRVASHWLSGSPRIGPRIPIGPPTVVGPLARRPPAIVLVERDSDRLARRPWLGDRARGLGAGLDAPRGQARIDTLQRLLVAALADERPR